MQSTLVERPSKPARNDLSAVARQYLESHPHFRGRTNGVSIAQDGRNLFLTGRLPTFYLKQLVQEAVRHVPGVQNVVNQIDVVSASGVSGDRN
jgi:hypothetical protein